MPCIKVFKVDQTVYESENLLMRVFAMRVHLMLVMLAPKMIFVLLPNLNTDAQKSYVRLRTRAE